MSDQLTSDELDTLKGRFRAAGCSVTDIDDTTFEMIGRDLPVRTHVMANPFFVQLGTVIEALPSGFMPSRASKIHAFLNEINLDAKLVKFTVDTDRPDPETERWPIMASVKLVTGTVGGNYEPKALENLILLWYQDIATLIARKTSFQLRAMMVEKT